MARKRDRPVTAWLLRCFLLLNACSAIGFIVYALILQNPPKTALPLGMLIVGCCALVAVLIGLVGSLRVTCCLTLYLYLGGLVTLAELGITLSMFFNYNGTVDALVKYSKENDPDWTKADTTALKDKVANGRWFFLVVCVLQFISMLVALVLHAEAAAKHFWASTAKRQHKPWNFHLCLLQAAKIVGPLMQCVVQMLQELSMLCSRGGSTELLPTTHLLLQYDSEDVSQVWILHYRCGLHVKEERMVFAVVIGSTCCDRIESAQVQCDIAGVLYDERAMSEAQNRGSESIPAHSGSAFSTWNTPQASIAPPSAGDKTVAKLTVSLVSTYQQCSPAFRYSSKLAPRRLLTKPADPASNSGWDNANHDLIVAVGDEFVSSLGSRYAVRDLLGQGTFGQVFKCVCTDDEDEGDAIAIKVVKNQAAYYHQARVEIGVLQYLNTRADPGDQHHIVRLKDFFLFRNHLCLAFELLSLNLYELIRHNKFRGLSLSLVRVFISQILDSMAVLRDSRIIHCDIKPENVLLKNVESGEVKVIDFGSACFESRTVYSYIQSRFYRSPEVVLGYPYAMSIDVWSLGCVAAELFLGLPLFPGACEHDLLGRIISTLGPLPDFLLAGGKNALKYFQVQEDLLQDPLTGEQLVRQRFLLRSRQQFEELTGQPAPVGKQYFKHSALADIIGAYPFRTGLSDDEVARERLLRESFTDFLLGVLDVNPGTRWTPRQAGQHPFITGARFAGPFQPQPDTSASPAIPTPGVSSRPTSGPGLQAQQAQQAQPQQAQHAQQQQQQQQQRLPVHGPVHTPGMQIPLMSAATRQQQAAAQALGAEQQQAAAANVAVAAGASPWAAAAAHAAALAAMQARYGTSQQQQYNAAHSLQNIVGAGALANFGAQLAGSYGAAAMQTTPTAQSLSSSYVPLLSPPSRSFHNQLRYADFAGQQNHSLTGMDSLTGLMPLLQTPTSATQHQPFSPGSFQPSSISTYHAALAAAQAALQQQQAQQQAQQLQQQLHQRLSQAFAQQAPGSFGGLASSSWQPRQHEQQQAVSLSGFALGSLQAAEHPAAAVDRMPTAAAAAAAAGAARGLPAGMLQQQLWASMDGSSTGGTPPPGGVLPSDEGDIPNPADFDPLWSDALLEEERQQQAQQQQEQQQQQHEHAPHAKRQHTQAAEAAQISHRRELSLSAMLPLQQPLPPLQQQQLQGQLEPELQASLYRLPHQALQAGLHAHQQLPCGWDGTTGLQQQASLQQQLQDSLLQQRAQAQQHFQQQPAPPQQQPQQQHHPRQPRGSLNNGDGDPLALAATCLPQLAELQAQQKVVQRAQAGAQLQADPVLSAFSRVAAAAADAGLHQALSLRPEHSTTITDGFASYTLHDAPSNAAAAAVAAAASAAAAQHAQAQAQQQQPVQEPLQRQQGFFSASRTES
ncbi:Dual specificity protein kinase YAK1 [Chlorella vulgaris]